jgi:hypothetical protein
LLGIHHHFHPEKGLNGTLRNKSLDGATAPDVLKANRGGYPRIPQSKLKASCLKFSGRYDAAQFIMPGIKKKKPRFKGTQRKPNGLREAASPYVNGDAGRQSFRFIDLFCGIGGFRMAFERVGAKCVFSSDWDKHSQITYEANFGEKPHGDIHQVAVADIPPH